MGKQRRRACRRAAQQRKEAAIAAATTVVVVVEKQVVVEKPEQLKASARPSKLRVSKVKSKTQTTNNLAEKAKGRFRKKKKE